MTVVASAVAIPPPSHFSKHYYTLKAIRRMVRVLNQNTFESVLGKTEIREPIKLFLSASTPVRHPGKQAIPSV